MRPSPIPDEEVWIGKRIPIAPPGGNWLDPDVSGIEALIEVGGGLVNRYHVRLIPEEGDLAHLERGDPLWLTLIVPQMPVFSIGFVVTSYASPVCKNCQKPLTSDTPEGEWTPQTVAFHRNPQDGATCPGPEITWVEADPPPLTSRRSFGDLQEVIGERVLELWGNTVEMEGLALAEEAGEACRAILKRAECHHSKRSRKTPEFWTMELRRELGQLVSVAMAIAYREGFDLLDEVETVAEALLTHDPDRRPND